MPYRNAHELWTKLQDKYGVPNIIEDDCSPSTSGRDEFSSSSTSPKCSRPRTNVMVSSDRLCNIDSELILNDLFSLSRCNASSLDLNSSSTPNVIPSLGIFASCGYLIFNWRPISHVLFDLIPIAHFMC